MLENALLRAVGGALFQGSHYWRRQVAPRKQMKQGGRTRTKRDLRSERTGRLEKCAFALLNRYTWLWSCQVAFWGLRTCRRRLSFVHLVARVRTGDEPRKFRAGAPL